MDTTLPAFLRIALLDAWEDTNYAARKEIVPASVRHIFQPVFEI
jgi:hypothetical protein